jgi:hypothetical protein
VRVFQNLTILSTQDIVASKNYVITGNHSKVEVLTDDNIRLKVYNMLGVQVVNEYLVTGIYLAKIINANNRVIVQKVFVK